MFLQKRKRNFIVFFFSSRRRHTRCSRDWSSDVCSSDLSKSGDGSGGMNDPHRPPGGRNRDRDPLLILDANNALYLANGGTVHDFAGWNVDLYAQVSAANVQS